MGIINALHRIGAVAKMKGEDMGSLAAHRVRRIAWIASIAAVCLVFLSIFALTVQTPAETSSLSWNLEEKLSPVDAMLAADASLWEILGTSMKAVIRKIASKFFIVAGIRKWAHTVEFFLLGSCLSLAVALWVPRRMELAARHTGVRAMVSRIPVALGLCVFCSLFDQVHKLFVPGREFDAGDLVFDALGYGLAILMVFGIAIAGAVIRERAMAGSHFRRPVG